MSLVVMGASYKTASIALRERLAVPEEEMSDALEQIVDASCVREAIIVSTCNRVELYVDAKTDRLGAEACADFFESRLESKLDAACFYLHRGPEAVQHLFRVVCSLDSQVLGEAQILGQMKRAFADSVEVGTCGEVLTQLFKSALQLGKRVRAQTGIGGSSVSLSTTAFKAARDSVEDIKECKVLLIGAGEMAKLAIRYLVDAGVKDIVITTRTFEHAAALAREYGACAVPFAERYVQVANADIVFTMTHSPVAVISASNLEQVLEANNHCGTQLVIIDEAVPRDVDYRCADLPGVVLYDQEMLAGIADDGLAERMRSVAEVERMVSHAEDDFLAWQQQRLVVPTIKEVYEKGDIVVSDELVRAKRELERVLGIQLDEEQVEVLSSYGNAVMKKLLHGPVMRLRREASSPDSYYYTGAARYLFGLDVFPPGKRRPCANKDCENGRKCPIGLQKSLQQFCRAIEE